MKKIVIPAKADRLAEPRPAAPQDAPRARLGLRYGADADARERP